MHQLEIQIGNMPLRLILLSNGSIVIVPMGGFNAIIEQGSEVNGHFFQDGFTLVPEDVKKAEDYSYRVMYHLDDYSLLKQWLIQQKFK